MCVGKVTSMCLESSQLSGKCLSFIFFLAFLRQNYEKFMNDVVAKAIAMELHHRDIILEEVRTKIERALSAREANGHLYDHLCSSATWERLELFCKVLMSEDNEGCARMKELGVEMLKIITKENKIVSSKSE